LPFTALRRFVRSGPVVPGERGAVLRPPDGAETASSRDYSAGPGLSGTWSGRMVSRLFGRPRIARSYLLKRDLDLHEFRAGAESYGRPPETEPGGYHGMEIAPLQMPVMIFVQQPG